MCYALMLKELLGKKWTCRTCILLTRAEQDCKESTHEIVLVSVFMGVPVPIPLLPR